MSDLFSIWKAICGEVGVNAEFIHVIFADANEARHAYGLASGWGGIRYASCHRGLPEVLIVFPYSEGENGLYFDMEEFKNTCYHELIHLLLPDEIEEEDVAKMADILTCRQKGWHFWCSYLSERAIARGLGPPDGACRVKSAARKGG